ncbi:MAG: hypothetical protein VB078_01730 [Clostridiaceae bacterium]|nr:hypothetical protein [Clostridiaceae bacterium]
MKKQKLASIILAAAMIASSLSGCALVEFEDPSTAKQEEQTLDKDAKAEKPDVFKLLNADKLVLSDRLKNAAGVELAAYEANFPYFDAGDNQALANINTYYETEFEHLESDKERFFQLVTEKPSQVFRTSVFTYTLLDTPGDYISILRCFESNDILGSVTKTYYCEVFSASTGWSLKFSDVFGDDSSKAVEALRSALEQWSLDKAYTANWVYNAKDEILTENFAFDGDKMYIGLPAYTAPGGETLIELSFESFEDFLK